MQLLAQALRQRWSSKDAGPAASTSGRPPPGPQSPGRGGAGAGSRFKAPGGSPFTTYNQFGEEGWDFMDDGGYTPFPANLPTLDGADGHGMELGHLNSTGLHLSDSKEIWGKLPQVRVRVCCVALYSAVGLLCAGPGGF
jgi:hypothetical protein